MPSGNCPSACYAPPPPSACYALPLCLLRTDPCLLRIAYMHATHWSQCLLLTSALPTHRTDPTACYATDPSACYALPPLPATLCPLCLLLSALSTCWPRNQPMWPFSSNAFPELKSNLFGVMSGSMYACYNLPPPSLRLLDVIFRYFSCTFYFESMTHHLHLHHSFLISSFFLFLFVTILIKPMRVTQFSMLFVSENSLWARLSVSRSVGRSVCLS